MDWRQLGQYGQVRAGELEPPPGRIGAARASARAATGGGREATGGGREATGGGREAELGAREMVRRARMSGGPGRLNWSNCVTQIMVELAESFGWVYTAI